MNVLEDSKFFEIKQGPYIEKMTKRDFSDKGFPTLDLY